MENNAEKERNNEIVEQQENREEKPAEKGKAKDILSKLKKSGENDIIHLVAKQKSLQQINSI